VTLLKGSEPWAMTAERAAQRGGYAARSELALRNALEAMWHRRMPDARIVHEIVMGEGRVRADMAAIGLDHIAAFEIKGAYDDTTRLLHQIGMYQLCVPEVWIVVAEKHGADAKLIRHLLPSVGLIVGTGMEGRHFETGPLPEVSLEVEAEAVPRDPVPECMLEMLWRCELIGVCNRQRIAIGKKVNRPGMIRSLLEALTLSDLMRETCTALRSRDAVWRADAPISAGRIPAGEVATTELMGQS